MEMRTVTCNRSDATVTCEGDGGLTAGEARRAEVVVNH